VGHLAYSFESLAPADVFYRHIEDEEHYLRHLEIVEKAIGRTLPRDYQVLKTRENRMVKIRQGRLFYLYEFRPQGNGCLVKFRVEWSGILMTLAVSPARKQMLISIILTDLLACEHTALLLMEKSLKEGT
jgi:hypothetical protein